MNLARAAKRKRYCIVALKGFKVYRTTCQSAFMQRP